ncbi:MAG TPA: tail fiber domain-containing protein [Xanthomonadaceae bacterium]|nr:tail fiber domain-containing protein [Xanthomonadaceae bacterium]
MNEASTVNPYTSSPALSRLPWLLGLVLFFCPSLQGASAQALSAAFTYQGELRAQGQPGNGNFDIEFRLYSAEAGGSQIGPALLRSGVPVVDGLFSVALDFGPAQFAGDRQWLELRIRASSGGSFETLSPRTELTATPYAWSAAVALSNSVTGLSIVDGSIGAADIDASQVQRRVTGSCPAGQFLRAVGQSGTVTCSSDSGGTVTSIATGAGLTGGPITRSGTVAIAPGGVGASEVNPAEVQLRVNQTCSAGKYLKGLTIEGKVICGDEPVGPPGWSLTGNSGTSSGNFIGTTDQQVFVIRTGNARSLHIEPSSILYEGLPITANVIAGSRANHAAPGVRGATISGGGVPTGWSDPAFVTANWNRVTEHYGTVGGGASNQAGDGDTNQFNASFATVGGGFLNQARGRASTVGGGEDNWASGAASVIAGGHFSMATGSYSTVGGGLESRALGNYSSVSGGSFNQAIGAYSSISGGDSNCAGGDYSWAGGRRAKARPADPSSHGGCAGLSYPGGSGDKGSFVWADSQNSNFVSTGENQFLVRSQGSVQFTHESVVVSNAGPWFRIRAPAGRSTALSVISGTTGVLTGFSNGGVRIGSAGGLLPPEPGSSGLLVMGGARRNDNMSTWDTTSDARVKRDIVEIEGAVDTLLSLRPTRFRYSVDFLAHHGSEDREHLGFIAQELAKVLPDSVSRAEAEEGAEHAGGLLQVNLSDVHVLTTAATRELAIAQRAMEAELADLRGENAELRAELKALRELVLGQRGGR